jgi:hypothetical protein
VDASTLRPLVLVCAATLTVVTVLMANTEAAWELRQRNEKFAEMDDDLWSYRAPPCTSLNTARYRNTAIAHSVIHCLPG